MNTLKEIIVEWKGKSATIKGDIDSGLVEPEKKASLLLVADAYNVCAQTLNLWMCQQTGNISPVEWTTNNFPVAPGRKET